MTDNTSPSAIIETRLVAAVTYFPLLLTGPYLNVVQNITVTRTMIEWSYAPGKWKSCLLVDILDDIKDIPALRIIDIIERKPIVTE